ncbi:MAG: helix-turn-helix domain-containing protein [Actinomycetota bacterium]|nr:helix-turn-helix domain-containing protein [Actinomycetota bacterium]
MSLNDQEPIFLVPKDAALLAGLSVRAIYRAIHRGELRAVRLCSRIRIPRAAFEDWIERSVVAPDHPLPEPQHRVAGPQGSFRRLLVGEERAE